MDLRAVVNRFVIGVLDALTIAGALVAAYMIYDAFVRGGTAIEIAATALVALALTVVPFSLSTVFHRMLTRARWEKPNNSPERP